MTNGNGRRRLSDAQVIEIREWYARWLEIGTIPKKAKEYGLSMNAFRAICKRETYRRPKQRRTWSDYAVAADGARCVASPLAGLRVSRSYEKTREDLNPTP